MSSLLLILLDSEYNLTSEDYLAVSLVFTLIFLIPFIFFLVAQQNVIKTVNPGNRVIKPGQVWLQLIPIYGLIWQFSVVRGIADSLRNELESRNRESKLGIWDGGITDEVNIHPTFTTGQWYCIMNCITCIPFVGFLTGFFALALWIAYWVQLIKYKKIISM